jgi:hypothetical protein
VSPKDNHGVEFAYRAGQIDPVKALNPGLIYEANEGDYICFYVVKVLMRQLYN